MLEQPRIGALVDRRAHDQEPSALDGPKRLLDAGAGLRAGAYAEVRHQLREIHDAAACAVAAAMRSTVLCTRPRVRDGADGLPANPTMAGTLSSALCQARNFYNVRVAARQWIPPATEKARNRVPGLEACPRGSAIQEEGTAARAGHGGANATVLLTCCKRARHARRYRDPRAPSRRRRAGRRWP